LGGGKRGVVCYKVVFSEMRKMNILPGGKLERQLRKKRRREYLFVRESWRGRGEGGFETAFMMLGDLGVRGEVELGT